MTEILPMFWVIQKHALPSLVFLFCSLLLPLLVQGQSVLLFVVRIAARGGSLLILCTSVSLPSKVQIHACAVYPGKPYLLEVSEFIEDCRVAICTLWRRSGLWRSASSRISSKFPMTGNLKLKIGQIVLVLIACRTCGTLALEQSQRGAGDEERDTWCTMVHDTTVRTRRCGARHWVYEGLVGRMLITVHEKKMRARLMDCILFG